MTGMDVLFGAIWCLLIVGGVALAVWHDDDHHGR